MNILMVLTSHDQLGTTGEKTGFWLEEFAAPYYVFKDAGAAITVASPLGGQPPLDPKSAADDFQTKATERFNNDPDAQKQLAATVTLAEVSADDFDAVFYPGGHGPLWDLTESRDSITLIEQFLEQNKAVAAVCHAPTVLLHVRDDKGVPVVKGRQVTAFSNSEEDAVGLTDVVPFLLEDALKDLGGNYQRAEDWQPYCTSDGLLITGQNPQSSELTAEALISKLEQSA